LLSELSEVQNSDYSDEDKKSIRDRIINKYSETLDYLFGEDGEFNKVL
jgi:hypothetical protein